MEDLNCCVISCEKPLDQIYWDLQYQSNVLGWDLGAISPAIQAYIDQLTDTTISILIPGCGNNYEAEYLISKGFSNITVIDIAPTLIEKLKVKFQDTPEIRILQGDFFEHQGAYDLILEQTFFCALPPHMRQEYVWKMHQLLATGGKIAGLLFNRSFEQGPPFGGNIEEYNRLFSDAFEQEILEECELSVTPRAQTELFFVFQKKENVIVKCYTITGITCGNCKKTVTDKIAALAEVHSAEMNSNFTNLIIVSSIEIPIAQLEAILAYEPDFNITLRN